MSAINPKLVTTAFELPGCRIVRNIGLVRGIVVRSRSIVGTLGASLQTLIGGNITLYTQLCEKAREDAYHLMLEHAAEHGANALIGVRYDANEVAQGVTEVLAYGTAVVVESTGDRIPPAARSRLLRPAQPVGHRQRPYSRRSRVQGSCDDERRARVVARSSG
jgi:uncharacterized protein YbjQ (UPF0145 family)